MGQGSREKNNCVTEYIMSINGQGIVCAEEMALTLDDALDGDALRIHNIFNTHRRIRFSVSRTGKERVLSIDDARNDKMEKNGSRALTGETSMHGCAFASLQNICIIVKYIRNSVVPTCRRQSRLSSSMNRHCNVRAAKAVVA